MTKLEIRKYTRDEIAEIIQIPKNDTKFKRKVTTCLVVVKTFLASKTNCLSLLNDIPYTDVCSSSKT